MSLAADSPYRVPFDDSFKLIDAPSSPCKPHDQNRALRRQLNKSVEQFEELQRRLYAQDTHAVLLVFQAMDAAGKDGTIRAVTSGVNPAGFQVSSFKQPSSTELDHDFLWRTTCRLPERGRVGVFNRSYYEEVLVVRVHPEYLQQQRLAPGIDLAQLWEQRFHAIREHERHLYDNGTIVLKFWLNVSKDEQRDRFLERIDVEQKNWKFSSADVKERQHWNEYMSAYEHALNATSRPWAPWYAIPADNKHYMRATVAEIIVRTLTNLDPKYPRVSKKKQAELAQLREALLQ
ncbi:MAG: PPK2 family polyphosphate:nucleotide phosphotransferase [Gammaproteobacteria bacterium]|jgi:PPK2 family polyphosphate:nucleotide phosphotransferase